MRLHILSVGASEVDKGAMLTPGVDCGKWVLSPVPAYLVETDDGDHVLIDTGMHPGHIDDPGMTWRGVPAMEAVLRCRMTEEHRIEHQLGLLGLTVDDVTHIVSSHLHFDHCGHHHLFAGRPILISERHLSAALAAPATFPPRYFDLPECEYVFTDEDERLLAGITAIDTPGHAPHHRSFLIDLPRTGPVILAIDAILSHHQIEADSWADQADPEGARESARRLQRMARDRDAMLLFGHDPQQWDQVRHPPYFYD